MNDDRADRVNPLYIDTESFLANEAGLEATGIAMDLITRVWWPTKAAFAFDEEALASRLVKELPARGYTAELYYRILFHRVARRTLGSEPRIFQRYGRQRRASRLMRNVARASRREV